jgi:hypothetical protein
LGVGVGAGVWQISGGHAVEVGEGTAVVDGDGDGEKICACADAARSIAQEASRSTAP